MHERASQQEEIRNGAKNMRLMLFPQQHKRDGCKAENTKKARECQKLVFGPS